MGIAVNVALVLAAAALVPSAGAFTPAVFLSGLTALVGALAIVFGHSRRGFLTIYFALSAAVVSPVFIDVERVDIWLVTLPIVGALIGAILVVDYNRRKSAADRI